MEVFMKKVFALTACIAMLILAFSACEDEPEQVEAPDVATAVYVINSGGSSISVIDLEADTVYNNVTTVGTYPNQLVYKNGLLYCVNSGSNNITIYDTENGFEPKTPISLGSGQTPENMVFVDDNTAYVSCYTSGKVLKVEVSTKEVKAEITAGSGTTPIAYVNGKIYAGNTAYNSSTWSYDQGTVTVIDPKTDQVLKTINVSTNPFDLKEASDGMLHVVCVGNYNDVLGKIVIIDPSTDTWVDTIEVGGAPGNLAIDETNNIGYLSVWGSGLMSYDILAKTVLHGPTNTILGKGGSGVMTDTEGNVYVSVWDDDQVIKLDKDANVLATYNVGDCPAGMAMKTE
jgi:YVTN family beta-propeller protein